MKPLTYSCLLVGLLWTCTLHGQSPWIPPKGEFSVNPSYTYETYDEYWFGKNKDDVPSGDVDINTFLLGFEYTLLKDLAFDATVGYTRSLSTEENTNDGLADTTLGARYRVLDEFDASYPYYVPTVTLRAGGILEGTYSVDSLEAPGKGASGFEISALVGKVLGESGFHVYGDLGYRYHGNDVPDDFFAGLGISRIFLDNIKVALGYRHQQSLSGPSVQSVNNFNKWRYPERKEFSENIELDIGYLALGGRYYGIRLGHTFAGRNTAAKLMLGFAIALPF